MRIRSRAAVVLSVGGMVAAASLMASDWPGWRGPQRTSLSPETNLLKAWTPDGPPLAWSAGGLGSGFSSISISGNRIYTMGDVGDTQRVLALNLADGKIAWSATVGPSLDQRNGGPRSTPAVDEDSVYAITSAGEVVCLKKADGALRWQRSIVREFGPQTVPEFKYAESPLIDGDRLLFTPGSNATTVVAVDKRTGKDLWRAAMPPGTSNQKGDSYSSIVISLGVGVKQYVQLTGRGLIGIRASDGVTLWSYGRVANDTANIPTPVVRGDYVFASTGYNAGAVLLKLSKSAQGVDAKEVYFLDPKTFQNHHGGFVLHGDFLYAGHGHNNGLPICIEFLTGKVRWGGDFRADGATGSAAVSYADERLYFRYQNGVMKLFDASPEGFKERGSFKIPGVKNPSWSHPVIHGGKLYLREQDTLLCYNVHE